MGEAIAQSMQNLMNHQCAGGCGACGGAAGAGGGSGGQSTFATAAGMPGGPGLCHCLHVDALQAIVPDVVARVGALELIRGTDQNLLQRVITLEQAQTQRAPFLDMAGQFIPNAPGLGQQPTNTNSPITMPLNLKSLGTIDSRSIPFELKDLNNDYKFDGNKQGWAWKGQIEG